MKNNQNRREFQLAIIPLKMYHKERMFQYPGTTLLKYQNGGNL